MPVNQLLMPPVLGNVLDISASILPALDADSTSSGFICPLIMSENSAIPSPNLTNSLLNLVIEDLPVNTPRRLVKA